MNEKPQVNIEEVFRKLKLKPRPPKPYTPKRRNWQKEIEAIDNAQPPREWEEPPTVTVSGQDRLPGF